jgi:hypothetical protein
MKVDSLEQIRTLYISFMDYDAIWLCVIKSKKSGFRCYTQQNPDLKNALQNARTPLAFFDFSPSYFPAG